MREETERLRETDRQRPTHKETVRDIGTKKQENVKTEVLVQGVCRFACMCGCVYSFARVFVCLYVRLSLFLCLRIWVYLLECV